MTVKDYITNKFQTFGINLSEADLIDISMTVSLDDELTADNKNDVYMALAISVIPQLMLRPKSLLKYYAWLCKTLGIDDVLNDVSRITDASDLW